MDQKRQKAQDQTVAPIWGAGNTSASKNIKRDIPSKRTTAGFAMNTTIGQHILNNPLIAQSIVDKAQIQASDTVLEIGPGTGNLTVRILEKAAKVIAVEMDPRMASELSKRARSMNDSTDGEDEDNKLEIILGDCLKVEFPYHNLCISNTPYQISSAIIYKILSLPNPPRAAVLMFQHEFIVRLLATPGDSQYGRLSATVQTFATVEYLMKVGRNNFRPPPAVESSVVRIDLKTPVYPGSGKAVEFHEYDSLMRICFERKNRTISACFKSTSIMSDLETVYRAASQNSDEEEESFKKVVKQKVALVLAETGYGEQRASKCDESDFLKLLEAFHQAGIRFT